jgi:origin recognition complex subunit 1
MPSETILPPNHKARLRRAENARKLLAGGRAVRDESDADEVSDDDGDWEWIYEESTSIDADAQSQAETKEDGGVASTRKRRHTNASAAKRIIGAKYGKFVCKIADCVLINNGTSNTDWVGVIWGFREDEDYEEGDIMKAQVWWFTSEKDIHSKLRKRADFLEVCSSS